MINLDLRGDPTGTKVYLTVDPVSWVEERVQEYINDLEAEVGRLRRENSQLAFKLAAVYDADTMRAMEKLEEIRDRLDTVLPLPIEWTYQT